MHRLEPCECVSKSFRSSSAVLVGPRSASACVFDAWTPDEHHRQARAPSPAARPSEAGAAKRAIGFGVLCMAAAFVGRDTWRYSVIAVIAGTVLLLFGAITNCRYLGAVDLEPRRAAPATARCRRRRPPRSPSTRSPATAGDSDGTVAPAVLLPPLSSGHDRPHSRAFGPRPFSPSAATAKSRSAATDR